MTAGTGPTSSGSGSERPIPPSGCNRRQWFEKSAAFDAQIRQRFLATHEAAAAGRLDTWAERPLAALWRCS